MRKVREFENSILIEVESIAQPCSAGLRVGDRFLVSNCGGSIVLENFDGCCPELFNTVFPIVMPMIHGGSVPWEDDQGRARSVCPDGHCRVQVAVSRLPLKEHEELTKIREKRENIEIK